MVWNGPPVISRLSGNPAVSSRHSCGCGSRSSCHLVHTVRVDWRMLKIWLNVSVGRVQTTYQVSTVAACLCHTTPDNRTSRRVHETMSDRHCPMECVDAEQVSHTVCMRKLIIFCALHALERASRANRQHTLVERHRRSCTSQSTCQPLRTRTLSTEIHTRGATKCTLMFGLFDFDHRVESPHLPRAQASQNQ